jgi:phage terminase large subunit GpA-like protein
MIEGVQADWRTLYAAREQWWQLGKVPHREVIFLTAGVDVQKNRLEVMVKGWGRDKQSWVVDYRVLPGDVQTLGPWLVLAAMLEERWGFVEGLEGPEALGAEPPAPLPIVRMAVDMGYATDAVYGFLVQQHPERVFAVRGTSGQGALVGSPLTIDVGARRKRKASVRSGKLLVWPVGTDFAKSELHGWLRASAPTEEESAAGQGWPAGFCHFPDDFSESLFQQLCAEQLVETVNKRTGQLQYVWQLLPGRRNEALDTAVYARAAASRHGLDLYAVARPKAEAGAAAGYDVSKEQQSQGTRSGRGQFRDAPSAEVRSSTQSRAVGRMGRRH